MTLDEKLRTYATRRQLRIGSKLGSGRQGSVFEFESLESGSRAAVKFFSEREPFVREWEVYERLASLAVTSIEGFNVPELVGFDEELLALEMTIVKRPFVLDFAGAYLDDPPEFPPNVIEEWREQKQEEFGKSWSQVEDVLMILRGHGIYLMDIHPGNIAFLEGE